MEKRLKTVYLCGPINGCTDEECIDWRKEASKRFYPVRDPMDRDYRGREEESVNEIVCLDKLDIDLSDLVLAFCPKPSVGTSMEIFYAWQKGKPVYAVVPQGVSISPWLRYHSTRIVDNFEEAFVAIEGIWI